jgi:hypothetical protein
MFVKNNVWSTENPRAFVSSALPKSPAKGYVQTEVNKIALTMTADDDFFLPRCSSDGKAEIFASLPGEKRLGNGEVSVIDCGFEISIPAGYRLSVSSCVSGLFLSLLDANRIKVSAFNASRECVLHDRQHIGKIWIEPVYFF